MFLYMHITTQTFILDLIYRDCLATLIYFNSFDFSSKHISFIILHFFSDLKSAL